MLRWLEFIDHVNQETQSLTQWLQLLYTLPPHRLNVDAGEAPVRGHLYEVGPPVAVGQHVAVELCMVQQVLAVSKVPRPECISLL